MTRQEFLISGAMSSALAVPHDILELGLKSLGMTMNRRLFLLSWIFQATLPTNLRAEVMEVFLSTDGPCALLAGSEPMGISTNADCF